MDITMNGLGSPRLLTIVIIVAGGLIACSPRDEPAPRPAPQAMPAPAQATTPPAPAAPAPAPALQGVVTGAGAAAVAVLAEPGKAPLPPVIPQPGIGAPGAGALPPLALLAQKGEDTHGIVGAQGIHGRSEGKRGIVLPQRLHREDHAGSH